MSWQRLKLSDHTKNVIKTIVVWTVVFVAYAYLIYQLSTNDYSALVQSLCQAAPRQWLWLVACLLLMPLNILLEALKWRYLLREVCPMTIAQAQQQVYYGFVGAFITPYRAGDYPSRVMLMPAHQQHWKRAIALGLYGSVVLTLVITLAGLGACWAYMIHQPSQWWYCLLAFIPLCLPRFARVSELCLARYLVFGLQLFCMLRLVGIELEPLTALSAIPFYYLLVTITPNIPISDPAIRGSWAVIAFGPVGAVAALGLWFINTILPLIIGGAIGMTFRRQQEPQGH